MDKDKFRHIIHFEKEEIDGSIVGKVTLTVSERFAMPRKDYAKLIDLIGEEQAKYQLQCLAVEALYSELARIIEG